ncbi:hypothetical protein [Daejeonella sp.]|uniref:hypothetical protein n=1 Tax=Daejeonella sp. TaxID=2805397 RepID=UPI003983A197
MVGRTIVGIHKETSMITPITEVVLTGLKCNCICHDCKGALEAVLNTRRRKHFRHSNKNNCNPSPETELHLLAKKIILDNTELYIAGIGMRAYTDPVTEVWCNDLVPDATVIFDGFPLYIEIVVTNPISNAKFLKYRESHSPVLVINLAEEDRMIDYAALEQMVIREESNRYILSYPKRPASLTHEPIYSKVKQCVLAGLAIALGIFLVKNRLKKRKYRRRLLILFWG